MTTWNSRTSVTTSWSARDPIRQPDQYLLTESGLTITTESGLSLISAYGELGTAWNTRIIPT